MYQERGLNQTKRGGGWALCPPHVSSRSQGTRTFLPCEPITLLDSETKLQNRFFSNNLVWNWNGVLPRCQGVFLAAFHLARADQLVQTARQQLACVYQCLIPNHLLLVHAHADSSASEPRSTFVYPSVCWAPRQALHLLPAGFVCGSLFDTNH